MLQCYAEASGQVINREKSSMYFGAKCSRQHRRKLAICANIQGRDDLASTWGCMQILERLRRRYLRVFERL